MLYCPEEAFHVGCGCAVFAGAATMLSKCGVADTDSDVAVAVRTSVVLVLAWAVVFATGASWLCYYYAVQQGQVSIVVPIDKLSAPLTVLFSAAAFKERIPAKSWCGLVLLTAGILALAAMA